VAFRPVISFDGKWVYFSDSTRQNFRIPVAGGAVEPLLGELTEGGRALPPLFHEPSPSPDGRSIAGHYQDPELNGERIAVLSLDSTTEHRFQNVPANARWAPDGKSLIFQKNGNLHRQPIPDGSPVQITKFTPEQIFAFAVSPSQKQWALVRGQVVSDVVLVSRRAER
jgi:Tol biopolymer transport system component